MNDFWDAVGTETGKRKVWICKRLDNRPDPEGNYGNYCNALVSETPDIRRYKCTCNLFFVLCSCSSGKFYCYRLEGCHWGAAQD